jgi:hypothetical protein
MRPVLPGVAALALAACTAIVGTRSVDGGGTSSVPTVTPTLPVVNVDDMASMYAQQTVLVTSADHVSAVTLLNHFIRYQIPTQGVAEVKADLGARWLYVLDDDGQGARRLGIFDLSSGTQRAALDGIAYVPAGRHDLGAAADGRVLVLKSDASRAWVDGYQPDTLQSSDEIMQGSACSDRLLTSAGRLAMVCSSTGEVTLGTLRGTSARIMLGLAGVVGAAIAGDGALFLLTADEHLAMVPPGSATPVLLDWPDAWSGSVVAESLAAVQSGTQIVIAQTNADGAWLRVTTPKDTSQRQSLRLAGVPDGGIVAMWPFAYYAVGASIRHVDLTSGLLETMAEVGPEAAAGAVVNG